MGTLEATEAKIDALRDSVDEVKKDVRELRADVSSLREKVDKHHSDMLTGFAALRESIAELRATMRTMFWAIGVLGMLATIFFTAGKALHWF